MKAVDLESPRLYFKRLTVEHLSIDYVNWINDSEVNRYMESRGNYTLEMLSDFLIENEKKDIYFWAIHLKTDDKHIGNIKIDPIDLTNKSGEYGIMMGDKNNWGKGYAKEASIAIINYFFTTRQLNKITLGVIQDNENAVLLYQKIGFEQVELKSNYGVYNDKPCNLIRMELVNKNA